MIIKETYEKWTGNASAIQKIQTKVYKISIKKTFD